MTEGKRRGAGATMRLLKCSRAMERDAGHAREIASITIMLRQGHISRDPDDACEWAASAVGIIIVGKGKLVDSIERNSVGARPL